MSWHYFVDVKNSLTVNLQTERFRVSKDMEVLLIPAPDLSTKTAAILVGESQALLGMHLVWYKPWMRPILEQKIKSLGESLDQLNDLKDQLKSLFTKPGTLH